MASGHADHPMDLGEAVIVAGIGCRRGTGAGEILAALDEALAAARLTRADVSALVTAAVKRDEPGIAEAASSLGIRLAVIPMETIAATPVDHRSPVAQARLGVPSIAEASARALGRRLILPRIVRGGVTCALAEALP